MRSRLKEIMELVFLLGLLSKYSIFFKKKLKKLHRDIHEYDKTDIKARDLLIKKTTTEKMIILG